MSESISFQERLDDEHRRALDLIPDGLTDFSSIDETRARVDGLMNASAARAEPVPGVVVEDVTIEGGGAEMLVRLYKPEGIDRPAPVLLFIHGGGFVVGKVSHFDVQCKQLATGAGIIVASVDYRLAPEHPYPGPMEDCCAALAWLYNTAAERGFDSSRVGVGGSSAGSGLAAGLALLARDRGDHPVAFQFLEAPMLDHRTMTPSSRSIDHPRVWNRSTNETAWAAYLGADHMTREISPYASPALATDLTGLPPAYISIGAQDAFLDEAFDYAQRLLRAGVSVQFHVYEIGFHGSPRVIPASAVSVRWRRDAVEAVTRLAGTGTQSYLPGK